jgi:hypothetical protein
MHKKTLGHILKKHKAQPVGDGYIDIIVNRDGYKSLVTDLITNEFGIRSISWWEWCPGERENRYGLGGPESRYYNGWFSELSVDVDDIALTNTREEQIDRVLSVIETKTISFPMK